MLGGGLFLTDEELEAERQEQDATSVSRSKDDDRGGANSRATSSCDDERDDVERDDTDIDLFFDLEEDEQQKAEFAVNSARTSSADDSTDHLETDFDDTQSNSSSHVSSQGLGRLGGAVSVSSAPTSVTHYPYVHQEIDDGLQFAMSFMPTSPLVQKPYVSGGIDPALEERLAKMKIAEEEGTKVQDDDVDVASSPPKSFVPYSATSALHSSMPSLQGLGSSLPRAIPKRQSSYSYTPQDLDEDDSPTSSISPSPPASPSAILSTGGEKISDSSSLTSSPQSSLTRSLPILISTPQSETPPTDMPAGAMTLAESPPPVMAQGVNPLLNRHASSSSSDSMIGSVPGVHDYRRKYGSKF